MKKHLYTISGLLFGLTFWLGDSLVHRFVNTPPSFRFIPVSPHELSMRLAVLLILLYFGYRVDRKNLKLAALEEEKRRIFQSTVAASQHVLNNFLNNMLYFQLQARESRALDEKTLDLFDQVTHNAAGQLKELGEISVISEKNIRDTVYPK